MRGLRHRAAVQCDRGDGVETVGDEIMAVGTVVAPVEGAGEPPVDVAYPLLFGFVVAVERVIDQSGVEQVECRFAGNGGGDACGEAAAKFLGNGSGVQCGKRPAAGERCKSAGSVGHHKSFDKKEKIGGRPYPNHAGRQSDIGLPHVVVETLFLHCACGHAVVDLLLEDQEGDQGGQQRDDHACADEVVFRALRAGEGV